MYLLFTHNLLKYKLNIKLLTYEKNLIKIPTLIHEKHHAQNTNRWCKPLNNIIFTCLHNRCFLVFVVSILFLTINLV